MSDHNLISKSEAVLRLRIAQQKIGAAISTLNLEDDWQSAHDYAYEAEDVLDTLLDHLKEGADAPQYAAKKHSHKPWKPPAPDPEPPGSLKYGQPVGAKERPKDSGKGAFGYSGSRHPHDYSNPRNPNAPPPVIKVEQVKPLEPRVFNMGPVVEAVIDAEPVVDVTPPEPIQRVFYVPPPPKPTFQAGDYAQWIVGGVERFAEPLQIYRVGGEFAFFASVGRPLPTDQLEARSAPVLPAGAEVVTFDIDRLMGLYGGAVDMDAMNKLNELPNDFRQTVLKTNALTKRPVTVWRAGDSAWKIK
jgi:hypothetical protein